MVLTDTHSGTFICLVEATPKEFIKSLDDYGALEALSAIYPKVDEIDYHNGFSVDSSPIKKYSMGAVLNWSIVIYGDNGMVEMTLTKSPAVWCTMKEKI